MKLTTFKTTSKICYNVFTILFLTFLVGGNIALANAGAINSFLGQSDTKEVKSEEESDFYHLPLVYSISDLKDMARNAIYNAAAEGVTMLKNENNALPLKSSERKISFYSSGSVNYCYTGGGSSRTQCSKSTGIKSLKDAFQEDGFTVNTDLWNFYSSNTQYYNQHIQGAGADSCTYDVNDANWSQITSGRDNDADVGMFVLTRHGTEASDHRLYSDMYSKGDTETHGLTNGNSLLLAPAEIDVLKGMKALKDAGKIKKIVVLCNFVNPVQMDFVDNTEYGIDSVLWCSMPGENGNEALPKIMRGEVNPSGKMPYTLYKHHYLNPVYANTNAYKYTNSSSYTINGGYKSNSYVVYQEGIYVGYRYTETRYADKVTNRSNVGDYNYEDVVKYPFGYGLSYTTFEYSDFAQSYDEGNDEYTLSVKVTNKGSVAGKESVQFYVNKPYTEYDVTNGIEKSVVDLVGYGKTGILAAGKSEVVTCKVAGNLIASYDANNAKTYIVDAGDYYFTCGKDAHSATNNILLKQGASASSLVGTGDATLVGDKYTKAFDSAKYSTSVTGETITNQFDNVDVNRYEHKGDNSVTYISRNNWQNTVKFGIDENNTKLENWVKLSLNADMVHDALPLRSTITTDTEEYPTYGKESNMTLASLLSFDEHEEVKHVDYEDSRWEELLDKMSWDDQVNLLSNGLRKTKGIVSIAKPETIDGNGALGPVGGSTHTYADNSSIMEYRFSVILDDPDKNTSPYQYPGASLLAATFNDEVIEDVGTAVGEDCLWCGYSGMYGLGVNTLRNLYAGRTFEYFSEDGVLSGKAAASEVKGIRDRGVYVYMKHAFLNGMEHNREGVCTWANEQSIREIYIRAFEYPITDAGAENLMTGFNRLGVVWTGQQGFINKVFRAEWGMQGFAVSDWYANNYMDLCGGIMNGNALPDGDTATEASESQLYKYGPQAGGYGKVAQAAREECHRILYVVVNSCAMNGISSSTRYVKVTPPWQTALLVCRIVSYSFFGLSAVALVTSIVLVEVKKKKTK